LPPEDPSSMSLEIWMADYVIDNNGDLAALRRNTIELVDRLIKHRPPGHRDAMANRPD